MRFYKDKSGDTIRMTEERLQHILSQHRDMAGFVDYIPETLAGPDFVAPSRTDREASLYYRMYRNTVHGDKFVCVVVAKKQTGDAFIKTAYITGEVK